MVPWLDNWSWGDNGYMIGQFVMRGLWLHDGTIGHEWGMGNRDIKTDCPLMSWLPSSCHDYTPYVTIIPLNHDYPCHIIIHQMSWLPPLMSQLPHWCHDYPSNVTTTLLTSGLPSSFHDYPSHVMITPHMSWLPSECHNYPPYVRITLLMSW